jgi:hypothetical protein
MNSRTAHLLAGVATVVAPIVVGGAALGTVHADEPSAPVYVSTIPPGYRYWKFISVAHEEGTLCRRFGQRSRDQGLTGYSDEMGHRFRCKWGSVEASNAG